MLFFRKSLFFATISLMLVIILRRRHCTCNFWHHHVFCTAKPHLIVLLWRFCCFFFHPVRLLLLCFGKVDNYLEARAFYCRLWNRDCNFAHILHPSGHTFLNHAHWNEYFYQHNLTPHRVDLTTMTPATAALIFLCKWKFGSSRLSRTFL